MSSYAPPHVDRRLRPVPIAVRIVVTELVAERGPRGAARELGMSRSAVMQIAAGLPCMPGTLAIAERQIAARSGR
jgi:hypothetical protein